MPKKRGSSLQRKKERGEWESLGNFFFLKKGKTAQALPLRGKPCLV
jgi:hypothetical protein